MISQRLFRHPIIGVDLGSRYVKIVQLQRHRGKPRIAAATMYRRTIDGEITDATVEELRLVLKRKGFVGRRIALATPSHAVRTSLIELPTAVGVDAVQLSRMEMVRIHRLAPDTFELACWPVPGRGGGDQNVMRMMAYACPHNEADALIDLFSNSDLDVELLDLESCALTRACDDMLGVDGSLTLLASLGWRTCHVVTLRGAAVAYERTFTDISLEDLRNRIATDIGGDTEGADYLLQHGVEPDRVSGQVQSAVNKHVTQYCKRLAEELSACLQYLKGAKDGDSPEKVLLAGGGADVPFVAERIGEAAQRTVERIAPANLMPCASSLIDTCSPACMTLALGLARHPGQY